MKIIEKLKGIIRPNDTTDPAANVEAARATLDGAERDRSDTAARLEEAVGELRSAEAEYDADPSEQLGEQVMQRRRARTLLELRAEKAQGRAMAAGAALAAAEHVAAVATLEASIGEAERARLDARKLEAEALAGCRQAHPAAALRALLDFNGARASAARAAHDKARGDSETRGRTLEELEARLQELAPDLAAAGDARRKEREALDLEELVRGSRLEAVREDIGPSLEVIVACEQLIREQVALINARVDRARTDAESARARGANVESISAHHATMHLLDAQHRATPPELRNVKQHSIAIGVLSGVLTPDDTRRPDRFIGYRFVLQHPPVSVTDRGSAHHVAPGDIDRWIAYPNAHAAAAGEQERKANWIRQIPHSGSPPTQQNWTRIS